MGVCHILFLRATQYCGMNINENMEGERERGSEEERRSSLMSRGSPVMKSKFRRNVQ